MAEHGNRTPQEIGPMRFRPPVRPLTIGELTEQLELETRPCAANETAGGKA